MSFRRRLKNKRPPAGWEMIQDVVEDFENQMKEAVNEEHEGKRRAELTYKIHRIHWEKNRFIYDLMYQRKVMSKELYDYVVKEKIADGSLISKWKKPGYEILCSMLAIQKGNHNFGTTSHCRVPLRKRAPQQKITPDIQTGCISCASGDGRFGGPIWWNTPLEDEEAEAEDNATTWVQAHEKAAKDDEPDAKRQKIDDDEEAEVEKTEQEEPAEEKEEEASESLFPSAPLPVPDDDEIPEEVKERLAVLKKSMGRLD